MISILLIITSVFVAVISYYLFHWTYWMRRGVPGPRGFPIVGVANAMLSSEFPPFLKIKEWGKVYGPIFGYTEGGNKVLVVSDPDLVQEVFVKQYDNFYARKLNPIQGDPNKDKTVHLFAAQGHRWKRLRAISSPTFSNNSLRKLRGTVEDSVMELMRHIEEKTAGGASIDLLTFYQEFTLDVIGRIALGQPGSRLFHNPLLPSVRAIFGEHRRKLLLMGLVAPSSITNTFIRAVRTFPRLFRGNPAIKILESVGRAVRERMDERETEVREDTQPNDFIDLFLDAKAPDDGLLDGPRMLKTLTFHEIIGQCFVFLVAGFDTTALSLSYSSFLLATNPRVQSKLQEEIEKECPDPEITFEQLSKLKYMEFVIKETLRLYPLAAPANARRCMRDTVIGNRIVVEEGTYIVANTWELHTNRAIWGEDAEEFKPERWESAAEEHLEHRGAYIPFGSGPRQCIGMRLAYMEEKLLMAHILRRYSFETGPQTQIPLKLVGRATTQPESVWMHLRPRD